MPRTNLVNPRRVPRFAGVSAFCRYPLIDAVEPDCLPVDWAIYGAPFDTGTTYRPGARLGPRAVRDESQYVKPYHIPYDLTLTDVLSLADAGDAPVNTFDCESNAVAVAEFAAGLGDPDHTRLLMVGGDHSNTLANLRAVNQRHRRANPGAPPLALIHFDSHVDTVDVTLGERYSHASPFIRAVEEGLIDPQRMLSIGIKGPLNTPKDLDYAREHGVTMITYEQWKAGGSEGMERIDAFLADLGDADAYLTFDIDCIDPAFAPGTGTPSIGGFTSAEALALLRHVGRAAGAHEGRGFRLLGADVVEVLPDRDHAGITALLAAHILFEILCLDALRIRNQR